MQNHNKQRFIDRIWQRIFRDADDCTCAECADTVENGIVVTDEEHALYMYEKANERAGLGILLNYRDVK